MLLTIYDKAGTKRADVAVNDSSTQSKEVQGDNVLSLSFSYYAFLPLDVNDYTDYLGERYWLTERYTPKQVSDGEWEYNLKLYGIESLIKRFRGAGDDGRGHQPPVYPDGHAPRACGDGGEGYQ